MAGLGNNQFLAGRAYQGLPANLGGLTTTPLTTTSLTNPLDFANSTGAYALPVLGSGFGTGLSGGLSGGIGGGFGLPVSLFSSINPTFGSGNSGAFLPRQNTPTGYPPPVSGDKASDIMFSVFQGLGIALKIRTQLNIQEQQQKELAATLKQQQLDALLNQGNALQNQMRQQWDAQDRRYAEEERRLGKCQPSNAGNRLATLGKEVANTMNTRGYCARGVQNTLEKAGYRLPRCSSAYQMAETLEKSRQFKSIPYEERQPGDIVVFNRTSTKRHGHVAIQLADGKQACDFVSNDANPDKYGGVKVFRPIAESVAA